MSKVPITIVENHGGLSTDLKMGPEHSFAYSRHIDFRKNPTGLSILPKTVATSAAPSSLPTDMMRLPSGRLLVSMADGNFRYRATNGTWSNLTQSIAFVSNHNGMYYNLEQDRVYFAGLLSNTENGFGIATINNADSLFGSPTGVSAIGRILDGNGAGTHANTYTSPGAVVVETAADRLPFTPTLSPTISTDLWIVAKGTFGLSLVLHDAAHQELGVSTLLNAQMTNGAYNKFTFGSSGVNHKVKPNQSTYHFHLRHPSGTATTVGSVTLNDFSTADYNRYAARLTNANGGLYPVIPYLQYMLIGHARYVAAWEIISKPTLTDAASQPTATEFLQHRLVLEPDYEVTSFALWGEYVAIAAGKLTASNTSVNNAGKLYFWDGTSANWNFAIDIPQGVPFSLYGHKNILYYIAGGGLWAWGGNQSVKIRQLPFTDTEYGGGPTFYTVNPKMITVRNDVLMIGFPTQTNLNSPLEYGVYSYGSRDKNFDDSFGYSYVISTGANKYTSGTGLYRIGLVASFGPELFIGWNNGSSYGLDAVDASSAPFGTATWESLVMDLGRPDKEKSIVKMIVDFEALPTGATVTPKYKINRASSWTNATPAKVAVAGQTSIDLSINKRFKELQVALDLVATTTTPQIISTTLIVETESSEQD